MQEIAEKILSWEEIKENLTEKGIYDIL